MSKRDVICSQQLHCLSCPLSIRVTGKDCQELTVDDIRTIKVSDVQSVNQWISVDNSLPPDNMPCVVVTKNKGLGVSRLMGRNKLEWTLLGKPVLYWMPVPEPPKDGDTNG